ncbi:MAG: elongation factor G [Alphaproteobacteria bacterium]|nr:elongation factor G [Alphaproteobacteria bacterium]MDX5368875.1 elongation factor G [Alphaproteobacteria bacterium]MDX5463599.1 elongation factor G [Alphaproteobacteria bacterium]
MTASGDTEGGRGAGAGAHVRGAPRCVAIVGTYGSGKTTLLESILALTGATGRKGAVDQGTSVGDAGAEARAHGMGLEVNAARARFMDEDYVFLDCPGSVEVAWEAEGPLAVADAVIVVTEADPAKTALLQPLLKTLDARGLPHLVFINKIDRSDGGPGEGRVRDLLEHLQPLSERPLILRQVPIWENGIATGYVDLALERAFVYREHAPSEVVPVPDSLAARAEEARYQMLERLSDHDDHLMEELLEDIPPPRDEVFDTLSREMRDGLVVPVFLGSALQDHGIRRLMKALRHEAPDVAAVRARLGAGEGGTVVGVVKTWHTAHGGKLSLARVLSGTVKEGDTLVTADGRQHRVGGLYDMTGLQTAKRTSAGEGETVALARMEDVTTGDVLASTPALANPARLVGDAPAPVYARVIVPADRKDEVKLSAALHKLVEEDPSVRIDHAEGGALLLGGQGDMHLKIAGERLAGRFGVRVDMHAAPVPYRETIRKAATARGRHKRQTGGHGQFGDVVVDVAPLPRGSGFVFAEKISGGVVPKQYFPAVEAGVKDALLKGPLGFPVVDLSVTLTDGSYHTVDSSEQAFRTAGRIAMQEALPNCAPVLLEPIMDVELFVPNTATARVTGIVTGRRGALMGYEPREGWPGWDVIRAQMPQAEIGDLILEVRSATQGCGSFAATPAHLAELSGREADRIVSAHAA